MIFVSCRIASTLKPLCHDVEDRNPTTWPSYASHARVIAALDVSLEGDFFNIVEIFERSQRVLSNNVWFLKMPWLFIKISPAEDS